MCVKIWSLMDMEYMVHGPCVPGAASARVVHVVRSLQRFDARRDIIAQLHCCSQSDRVQRATDLARDLVARAREVSRGLSTSFAAIDNPARFPALYIPSAPEVRDDVS